MVSKTEKIVNKKTNQILINNKSNQINENNLIVTDFIHKTGLNSSFSQFLIQFFQFHNSNENFVE